jgi:ABC-type spermidine/putrescine transport system permease subunit II
MVSDKTKFKRLFFTVLTLSLLVSAVMLSVGLLSWFAGLGDWGNRHYRSWLAIEILLVSVATVLFVFYRKPSMHPFERPLQWAIRIHRNASVGGACGF